MQEQELRATSLEMGGFGPCLVQKKSTRVQKHPLLFKTALLKKS